MTRRFHLPALAALAAKLGAIAMTVAADPAVVAHVAGKIGVSATVLLSLVQAVTQPIQKR